METRKIPTGFIEVLDTHNNLCLVNINHIKYMVQLKDYSLMGWQNKVIRIYFAHHYEYGTPALDVVGTYDEIVEEIRKAQGIGE